MKKVTVIILMSVLAVSLAGCSRLPSPTENDTPKVENTEPVMENTEPEELVEDDTPEVEELVSDVTFDIVPLSEQFEEYADITGLDADGNAVWTYQTETCPQTELQGLCPIGLVDDTYYFTARNLYALEKENGAVKWINTDFSGASIHYAFGDNGVLFLTGYYGPNFFAVDADGNTLALLDDGPYFWAYDIVYENGIVTVWYEGDMSGGEGGMLIVDTSDYSYQYTSLDGAIQETGVCAYASDYSEGMQATDGEAADGNTVSGTASETGNSTPPTVIGATATSALYEAAYNIDHPASNVLDGSLSTAWVEAASGQGEGESITISLDRAAEIKGFSINAGYQKSADLYDKNSRPKEITVSLADGVSYTYTLEDTNSAQTILFDYPANASSITITINSVYAGYKYSDTAISEIGLIY